MTRSDAPDVERVVNVPVDEKRCQFCRKAAEWVVRGIDESTSEDVRVLACHAHRGKSGRLGPVVMKYRQRIYGREPQ